MERRSFLKFLLATPLAAFVDYEKLLWIPGEKTIFIPSPVQQQVEIYNMILESPSLYGIPYHLNNATAGQWLGLPSEIPVKYEKISLDKAIEDGHVYPYEVESLKKWMKFEEVKGY